MAKVTIKLKPEFHAACSIEIDVKDILWISGKAHIPGCNVSLTKGGVLRSSEEPTVIRNNINAAIYEQDEQNQRG